MPAYSLQLTTEATQDVTDTFLWFEENRRGLGVDFLVYLNATLHKIKDNLHLFHDVSTSKNHIMRALLSKFNYTIFYTVNAGKVRVLAVVSSKQDKARWKQRR